MKILKTIGILVLIILLAAAGYVAYVVLSYSRIEDNQTLTPSGTASEAAVEVGKEYTIATQNIGFGAYVADFTFFMDGGKESWARSEESVIDCVNDAASTIASYEPDFVFFQEVDTDSTRSYHVDEAAILENALQGFSNVRAVNYHSAFLMYPFNQPHGASNSCIMTFSKAGITEGLRRQLTISTSFSKFLDLDRCYSKSRVPVDNGAELVLFNVHLSAYGGSDEIRTSQMTQLFNDIKSEYDKGNYVVCGGDFNHDFTGDSKDVLNNFDTGDYGWAQPLPVELLPEGLTVCTDYNDGKLIASCRNCDIPYVEGNFVVVVDGFIVTDNVTTTYLENKDLGFEYSDHNPVVMKFVLE